MKRTEIGRSLSVVILISMILISLFNVVYASDYTDKMIKKYNACSENNQTAYKDQLEFINQLINDTSTKWEKQKYEKVNENLYVFGEIGSDSKQINDLLINIYIAGDELSLKGNKVGEDLKESVKAAFIKKVANNNRIIEDLINYPFNLDTRKAVVNILKGLDIKLVMSRLVPYLAGLDKGTFVLIEELDNGNIGILDNGISLLDNKEHQLVESGACLVVIAGKKDMNAVKNKLKSSGKTKKLIETLNHIKHQEGDGNRDEYKYFADKYQVVLTEFYALNEKDSINKDFVSQLIEILEDNYSERAAKVNAIDKLASLNDNRAIEPLINCLDNSLYPDVRQSAAGALGKLKANKAVEHLINHFEDSQFVSEEVSDALANGIVPALTDSEASDLAKKLIDKIEIGMKGIDFNTAPENRIPKKLDYTQERRVFTNINNVISACLHKARGVYVLLLSSLENSNLNVQLCALDVLGPTIRESLVEQNIGANNNVSRKKLKGTINITPQEKVQLIDTIIRLLKNPALKINSANSIVDEILIQDLCYGDGDGSGFRYRIYKNPELVEPLIAIKYIPKVGIIYLGELRDKRATECLLNVCKDEKDKFVSPDTNGRRLAAINALVKINDPKSLNTLTQMFGDEDKRVGEAAMDAVQKISKSKHVQ